jgi:ceramide glucosyltransferase
VLPALVPRVLLASALVGLAASTVYLLLAAAATRRFRAIGRARSQARTAHRSLPPVSVLKPVHGAEPCLEECLESFFRQRYAEFELIFAGRRGDDAAWDTINRLRLKYSGIKSKVVISGDPVYANAKVSALEAMIGQASFPYLVIADSDARVGLDCLANVVQPLLERRVGLVTCPYRGVPTGGLCSRLEALGMSVEMTSGVLVADMLEGMRFALGPTTATRIDVLQTIGGIGSLGDYCADDYLLGQRIHATGKTVILSEHVIEHVAVNRSFRASMQHQIRWMRSTRFSRPWGHIGTGLTFAMPFGILGFAAGASLGRLQLAVALAGWAVANRVLQCLIVGWGAVRDRESLRYCWIYPARDLVGFLVWCASFLGTGIVWRDERYELTSGGRLRRKGPAGAPPIARGTDVRIHPDPIP